MSDPGAAPAAAAPAAAPAAAAPAAAPAAAAPAAFDWTQQGLDAETSTYVAAKGWKGPGDLVQSYRGAEKLLSVPPDQIVKLPQGEFNQEVFNTQVADRLGRPKDAAGYELTKLVPAGQDTKFAETAAGEFHKLGLTARQAQDLTKWWNGQAGAMTTAQAEAAKAREVTEVSALKAEWGQSFESNAALVDKAAGAFGMTADQVTALKTAMGPKAAMTFLHNIGTKMGVSDSFITGANRETNFAGGMTQDQAKAEIATLKADKGFMDKYLKNDSEAKQRMTNLMARAHPGTLTL